MTRFAEARRRYPVTFTVTALTALVGAAQFVFPAVLEALRRDPAGLRAGEWWRIATPLLVQSEGCGQYLFNVGGSILVGVAVERHYRGGRWLTVYLAAGVAGQVLAYVWQPTSTGAGSSDAVAGLIGAMIVSLWSTRQLPWWPGYLYAAYFASYLTGLDAAGPLAGTVVGSATAAAVMATRRTGHPERLPVLLTALVVASAVAMIGLRDTHGVGLLTGLALGAILSARQPSGAAGVLGSSGHSATPPSA